MVGRVRFALVNSGLGVLAAAAELRRLRPDADLVIAIDPDGMPWGPRSPDDIAKRSLICAEAAARYEPDVLVFACNTASVHALAALRAEFEPEIPVVGTVPAIKPAAAAGDPVAIWATAATTGSRYQRNLIAQFASGVPVTEVACPGLADAIDAADEDAIGAGIAAGVAQTPPDVRAIVLGCTEYELIGDRIRNSRPGVRLHGSAPAVAAQALRRALDHAALPADGAGPPGTAGPGTPQAGDAGPREAGSTGPEAADGPQDPAPASRALHVLLSGRPGELPTAALRYPEGRFLAGPPPTPTGLAPPLSPIGRPRTAYRPRLRPASAQDAATSSGVKRARGRCATLLPSGPLAIPEDHVAATSIPPALPCEDEPVIIGQLPHTLLQRALIQGGTIHLTAIS